MKIMKLNQRRKFLCIRYLKGANKMYVVIVKTLVQRQLNCIKLIINNFIIDTEILQYFIITAGTKTHLL